MKSRRACRSEIGKAVSSLGYLDYCSLVIYLGLVAEIGRKRRSLCFAMPCYAMKKKKKAKV